MWYAVLVWLDSGGGLGVATVWFQLLGGSRVGGGELQDYSVHGWCGGVPCCAVLGEVFPEGRGEAAREDDGAAGSEGGKERG